MAIEISILSGLAPRKLQIDEPTVVVGRDPAVDLVLAHPEISRRHCRLIQEGDEWWIEDLGSRSGTRTNGVTIEGKQALHPGDRISLGPVLLDVALPPKRVSSEKEETVSHNDIWFGNRRVNAIPLQSTVILGRGDDAQARLDDQTVSRQHARIETGPNGYRIIDLHSRSGSFVNGRRFDEHDLVIGDRVQLGKFYFSFNGKDLIRQQSFSLGEIQARDLVKTGKTGPILDHVSFRADAGQFIGILGPSGAGKTTLLNALSGLRPVESGEILIDRMDLRRNFDRLRTYFGYVPQDDIVHAELTVSEALFYSARLRLPADTPILEIKRLIGHTMANLGLLDHRDKRIAQLSGGQRKRVSVGVELLHRPPLLFLDEPTSGLDPLAEFRLMELLRRLADTGCTVICTTHVMENVYLMDQIAVLMGGRLIFQGSPESARTRFSVARLTALYDALQTLDPAELPPVAPVWEDQPEEKAPDSVEAPRKNNPPYLSILLNRLITIYQADPKNILLLIGQPVIIALLVCWVTSDPPLIEFFTYISALWFGCSNAAQEIVKELPIYRRERLVGLDRTSYLFSKFAWFASLTAVQTTLIVLVTALTKGGVHDGAALRFAGLMLLCIAGTGIGLLVSTLARSALQAAMLVPLILIPQILFSGFTVPLADMPASVATIAQAVPTFAAQRVSDVAFLLNKQITGALARDLPIPYSNLNELHRQLTGERLRSGAIFVETGALWSGYSCLVLWSLLCFGGSYFLLARKERE